MVPLSSMPMFLVGQIHGHNHSIADSNCHNLTDRESVLNESGRGDQVVFLRLSSSTPPVSAGTGLLSKAQGWNPVVGKLMKSVNFVNQ